MQIFNFNKENQLICSAIFVHLPFGSMHISSDANLGHFLTHPPSDDAILVYNLYST